MHVHVRLAHARAQSMPVRRARQQKGLGAGAGAAYQSPVAMAPLPTSIPSKLIRCDFAACRASKHERAKGAWGHR